MWRSPNGTIRNILGGVVFREPIICRTSRGSCPAGPSRSSSAVTPRRPVPATDFKVPGAGTLTMTFTPEDGGEPVSTRSPTSPARRRGDGHVQLRRLDPRLRPGVVPLRPDRNYPVYMSTKNTILKAYDGRFKDLFQEVFDAEFKADFERGRLTYEHRLIDDMVAAGLKWEGGYVWACKNYDGDVQSDTVAQGFGSLGLMTSVLMTPRRQDRGGGGRARHGHPPLPQHQRASPTSTNPIASIFAWTRGLAHRGKLDGTPTWREVRRDARAVCVETVEGGR
jgi:isocitrate dehydrogenase